MLTGKQFQFYRSVTGIQLVNGEASVITIPRGGFIKVLSGPDTNGRVPDKGIVYVTWEEHTVAVFAVDIESRAIEQRKTGNRSARA
jgi:hypothetical protein